MAGGMVLESLLVVSVLVMALGVALVWRGVRGRREGEMPFCRGCGFDLSGIWRDGGEHAGEAKCPECGRELRAAAGTRRSRRTSGVVVGRRRARRGLVAIGLGCLLIGLAGSGMFGLLVGSRVDWAKMVPTWIVARLAAGDEHVWAVNELSRRASKGILSASELRGLVPEAMKLRTNPQNAGRWLWVMMAAADAGALSDEQRADFARKSVSASAMMPARMRSGVGELIPLDVRLSLPAFGVSGNAESTLGGQVNRVTIDAKVNGEWVTMWDDERDGRVDPQSPFAAAMFNVIQSPLGGFESTAERRSKVEIPLGKTTVRVSMDVATEFASHTEWKQRRTNIKGGSFEQAAVLFQSRAKTRQVLEWDMEFVGRHQLSVKIHESEELLTAMRKLRLIAVRSEGSPWDVRVVLIGESNPRLTAKVSEMDGSRATGAGRFLWRQTQPPSMWNGTAAGYRGQPHRVFEVAMNDPGAWDRSAGFVRVELLTDVLSAERQPWLMGIAGAKATWAKVPVVSERELSRAEAAVADEVRFAGEEELAREFEEERVRLREAER